MKNIEISPSLLSADFMNLEKDIKMLNESSASMLHLDIMDGVFVSNITFGIPIIKQIRKKTDKILDTHLMIVQPEKYIKEFKNAGANILTVHYEASTHLNRTIQEIKELGMKAGVALNPHTNVNLLENILPYVDLILIMSVNPGFGGQSFIENSLIKIKKLKQLIDEINPNVKIEVDGGVNLENYTKIINAGADILVAGNAVFSSKNPIEIIKSLKEI
ncbi:MAG: ribulose-phosphate 3-epimerase [Bacteroidales bacterium]|jgi:ribulose-phosphate 3-epimerase|nr:ribulose-phosphate 3-epimerase [Bacteroidales bacterium]